MDHKNIYEYVPTEEREMADTYIALIEDGKSKKELLEYVESLSSTNLDDRAMLEALSKGVTDLDVRKEATRKLYYTR